MSGAEKRLPIEMNHVECIYYTSMWIIIVESMTFLIKVDNSSKNAPFKAFGIIINIMMGAMNDASQVLRLVIMMPGGRQIY
jgi:hypothetical protein